jgi:hypothetical protein
MDENLGQDQSERFALYEIRLKGHLDEHWSEWLGGLTVTYDEQDNTLLAGPVVDQAALHGLLKKVRDLGLPLISINPIQADSEEMS